MTPLDLFTPQYRGVGTGGWVVGGQGGSRKKGEEEEEASPAQMPKAISSDLRWRVVWLYIWDGWDERDIGKTLRLSRDTVKRTLEHFFDTGEMS